MDDIVERVEKLGDALGVVWAFFQDESGELTVLASLLLAALALVTALRCFQAMKPALEQKLASVIGVGSAITAVFTFVGVFFLAQAANRLFG